MLAIVDIDEKYTRFTGSGTHILDENNGHTRIWQWRAKETNEKNSIHLS